MGLGISFTGKKKSGIFSKKIKADELMSVIQDLGKKYGYTIEQVLEQNSFQLEFCPTGYVEVNLKGDKIEGESQTNVTGPGFHKAVVDFITDLSSAMNLSLQVDDETSYWNERNFDKLQEEHLAWLTAVFNNLSQYNETSFLVSWAIGAWRPTSEENLVTPMGPYSWEYIKSTFENGSKVDFARDYFIWFNSTKDAYYHRGVALYLMWNDFCWTQSRDDSERTLGYEILAHIESARKADENIRLPINEYKEISELIEENRSLDGPNFEFPAEIGYRRKDIIFSFPGGWETTLPGDFIVEAEEEGYVYWNEGRNFRLSAYLLKDNCEESFFDRYKNLDVSDEDTIFYESDGYQYIAEYRFDTEDDGTSFWVLQGQILGFNKTAVITITWQDEKWMEWAINAFKSTKNTINMK